MRSITTIAPIDTLSSSPSPSKNRNNSEKAIKLTGGNQDLLCLQLLCLLSVPNPDHILTHKASVALEVLDLVLDKVSLVDAIQTLNVRVALVLDKVPVEVVGRNIVSIPGSIAKGLGDGCGVPHDLLGDAADINTGATEATRPLDESNTGAVLAGAASAGDAARAAAYNEKVVNLALNGGHCGRIGPEGGIDVKSPTLDRRSQGQE